MDTLHKLKRILSNICCMGEKNECVCVSVCPTEGLSSGQVAGIVIGALLAVVIVIAVVIAAIRRMGKYS